MEKRKMTVNEMVNTDDWKRFMKRLDFFSALFLVIIVLMIAFGMTNFEGFGLFLSLTLSTLSIYCFFIGLQNFGSGSKFLSFFFYKIYGFGLSLGFLTLLYIEQRWPCPKELLLVISIIMISISLILGIIEITGDNKNNIDWKYFVRIIVAFVPLIYTMLLLDK